MQAAAQLLQMLRQRSMVLGCAESCTGGLLASALTDIPGCSDVFMLGQVPYANAAKTQILGVDQMTLEFDGAVSAEVAIAMADAVTEQAQFVGGKPALGISTTGIAGPEASAQKPVGLVYIGIRHSDWPQARFQQYQFQGDRLDIRAQTVAAALEYALVEGEAWK